jgi:hypothetical protein
MLPIADLVAADCNSVPCHAISNESLFLMKKQFCFFYFMMVRVLGYDSFDESRFSLRCGVRVPGRPINRFQGVVKDLGMEKASS